MNIIKKKKTTKTNKRKNTIKVKMKTFPSRPMVCKKVNLLQYLRNCFGFPSYAFILKENSFENLSMSLMKYSKRHKKLDGIFVSRSS